MTKKIINVNEAREILQVCTVQREFGDNGDREVLWVLGKKVIASGDAIGNLIQVEFVKDSGYDGEFEGNEALSLFEFGEEDHEGFDTGDHFTPYYPGLCREN